MTPKQRAQELTAKTIIQNLNKRQMVGYYCPDSKSAVEKALELVGIGSSVGWGGSATLKETGLLDALKQGDYRAIDRTLAKTPEEQKAAAAEIFSADCFLMSTNAITLDGELVNIDGRGNRVSYLCYGPEKVIILAGMNKVVSDVESGVKRVRDIASPPNTVRLNKNTPCAVTGRCGDCLSPDCICSQVVVTRRSGIKDRIQVILIGEELGF